MDLDNQKILQLEYTEGNQTARQIDNRIWAIYAIYFGLLAAAVAVVFRDCGLHGSTRLFVSGTLVVASIAQMALVGHLQSYSDRVYDRLRELEDVLHIKLHKLFEPVPPVSERLWGFHKWLSRYRARGVMQIWAIGVSVAALCYGFLDFNGGTDMIEAQASVALAQVIVPAAFKAVCVICVTLVVMTLIDAIAKVKVNRRNKKTEDPHGRVGAEGSKAHQ